MLARLAETRAAHEHGAKPEFTVDEMIEGDTGRCDVAAGTRSGEFDPEPFPLSIVHAAEKRLDSLNLDQRTGVYAPGTMFTNSQQGTRMKTRRSYGRGGGSQPSKTLKSLFF